MCLKNPIKKLSLFIYSKNCYLKSDWFLQFFYVFSVKNPQIWKIIIMIFASDFSNQF